jgi:hypothetical protein
VRCTDGEGSRAPGGHRDPHRAFDDVGGFENFGNALSGGIAVTGNYPGRARTPEEALQRLREERWEPIYPAIQPGLTPVPDLFSRSSICSCLRAM